ncbi:hypothetical protein PGTUg99_029393 [Puccinia graminis f. sp. tritici]|uniref:Uncharacterized protein n=1 Tax=Puccinia graminis f. sp. tritici TaxID=56615 RepID=A0A5B0MGR1_PUCGR|nr:hypothetical protein PGTUg99_029393 [Puccinia graminis f. sp. tritici]
MSSVSLSQRPDDQVTGKVAKLAPSTAFDDSSSLSLTQERTYSYFRTLSTVPPAGLLDSVQKKYKQWPVKPNRLRHLDQFPRVHSRYRHRFAQGPSTAISR